MLIADPPAGRETARATGLAMRRVVSLPSVGWDAASRGVLPGATRGLNERNIDTTTGVCM
jgi:hypothetical protein